MDDAIPCRDTAQDAVDPRRWQYKGRRKRAEEIKATDLQDWNAPKHQRHEETRICTEK